MTTRTVDGWRMRGGGAASPDAELQRRAKQIQDRNPGHPWSTAMRAAEAEAAAARLAAMPAPGAAAEATLDLRARQLQSANLDLGYADARELARLQLANTDTADELAYYRPR